MMLALLAASTLATLLLPMLPALSEWLRPSDVRPLSIEEGDALDPPLLARRFAERLRHALQDGAARLGRHEIVAWRAAGADDRLPLSAAEQAARASRRVWQVEGSARLPEGVAFYAEVAADGSLRTGERGVYRALLAGRTLRLGRHATVLRWAHGREVFVQEGCHLAGRVTAGQQLVLGPQVRFTLLHAPRVQCLPACPAPPRAAPAPWAELRGVRWDAAGRRALCPGPRTLADGTGWRGDLVCEGDLTLGRGCVAEGSIKARGRLVLGPGCRIAGSLFAGGEVVLGEAATVGGVVVSDTRVQLGAGVCVGSPGAPSTVAAPQIRLAPGVLVHGTVWAGEQGASAPEARP